MAHNPDVRAFLTSRRARISPEDIDLRETYGERRVPGLRREEVAFRAGVSTSYYTRMERGDLSGVTEGVLKSLAQALCLTSAETQHLFGLAAAATSTQPRSAEPDSLSENDVARLTAIVNSWGPSPALTITAAGDIVASNHLGSAVFSDLFDQSGASINHARYLFTDPRARQFYRDWEHTARDGVSILRYLVGQPSTSPRIIALVGELANSSNEFRLWWGNHDVRIHAHGIKKIHHPVVGDMDLAYEVLAVTSLAGVNIVTYNAHSNSDSAERLRILDTWAAADGVAAPALHVAESSP